MAEQWCVEEKPYGFDLKDERGGWYFELHDGRETGSGDPGQEFLEEQRKLAHLIAAAPDLYEALDQLMNDPKLQTGIGGNPHYVDEAIEKAKAALAKAKGITGE